MILYLTHNDQPSGVYWSQVTDTVAHLNGLGGPRVRLLALVSGRGFIGTRKKIRRECPDALVLPMVPGVGRWHRNTVTVRTACRVLRPKGIMARGALATWMALRAKEKGLVGRVCFDARGAYAAEWEEYRVVDNDGLIAQMAGVEGEAVLGSDIRLAVSHALVHYWQERFGYAGQAQVVVPCTLGRAHLGPLADGAGMRAELGFAETDVVLVYAGSAAGWQSFELLERLLSPLLLAQPHVKVLFLCPANPAIDALAANWLGRAVRAWVDPSRVPELLAACDHALLVREDSVTNRVSSPTKFAEYIACGLPVVISAQIGDFSRAVQAHQLGFVHREGEALPPLERPTAEERRRLHEHALAHYTKPAHDEAYRKVLEVLAQGKG